MTLELPPDARTLRKEIARSSLEHGFRVQYGEELPSYVRESPREIGRAEQEWFERNALRVTLLARVATQTLSYLEEEGHEAALTNFTSSLFTQPELDGFMRNVPYLTKLLSETIGEEDLFRSFLTLLKELDQGV